MDWYGNRANKFPTNRCSQDSAVGSHGNSYSNQNSQGSELSQDVFSQSFITSQKEKPLTMYEKWKTKQSILRRDMNTPEVMATNTTEDAPGSSVKMSYSGLGRWDSKNSLNSFGNQNYISSSKDKTTDFDERKVLDKVVGTVKDCNNELKSSLLYLMERLEKVADVSNGELAKTISSFLDNIWKHEEDLKKIIQDDATSKTDVTELKVNLSKKDQQIAKLEEQLEDAKKMESQKFIETMKAELQSLKTNLEKKSEELQAASQESESKMQTFIMDCVATGIEQNKDSSILHRAIKNGIKDSEKRIITDISKTIQKMESKQISQIKDQQKEWKRFSENVTINIVQSLKSHIVSKDSQKNQTNSLRETLQLQCQEMLQSLEQFFEREIEEIKKQAVVERNKRSVGTSMDKLPERMDLIGRTEDYASKRQPSLNQWSSTRANDEAYMQCELKKNQGCNNITVQDMDYAYLSQDSNCHPHSQRYSTHSHEDPLLKNRRQTTMAQEDEVKAYATRTSHKFNNMPLSYEHSNDLTLKCWQERERSPLKQTRTTPLASPFPVRSSSYSHKKGPSPFAVVLPQRQTFGASQVSPLTKPCLEAEGCQFKPPAPQNVKKAMTNKRKCVYTNKKNSGKKKCVTKGPYTDFNKTNEPPKGDKDQKYSEWDAQVKRIGLSQNKTSKSHNNAPKYQGYLNASNIQSLLSSSSVRQSRDAYDFDEPDEQNLPARPRLRSSTQLSRLGMATPKGPVHCTSTTKGASLFSNGTNMKSPDSLQSSPAISVASLSFHRKVRTPFRGDSVRRALRTQWSTSQMIGHVNYNRVQVGSPCNTILSDISNT